MSDQLIKTEFQILLKAFNDLVDPMPPIEKVKKELLEIADAAKNSPELNSRQREALIDRVKYYLNGEYGRSQKKIAYMNENK